MKWKGGGLVTGPGKGRSDYRGFCQVNPTALPLSISFVGCPFWLQETIANLTATLKANVLFAHLDTNEFQDLIDCMFEVTVEAGKDVMAQGMPTPRSPRPPPGHPPFMGLTLGLRSEESIP